MQVSASTVSAAPASASSSLVSQVERQAAILADDSGATTDQQIAAEPSAVKVTLSDDAKAALSSASGDQALDAAAPFKNQDRFATLMERVNNASGAYTETEQLDAYAALHEMAVTGGLIGMGEANQKLYNQAGSSAIGQKVKQMGQAYTLAMMAGAENGGEAGARRAALDFFDGQSASNQDVLFRAHINAPDMTGARPFGDVNSWRTSMLAGILLAQRADQSQAERGYEAGSVASKQV